MSSLKLRKRKIVKISRFFLVFILIFSWVFGGRPEVLNLQLGKYNLNFPPKIQKAQAAIALRGTPKIGSASNGGDVTLTFDTGGSAPLQGDVVFLFGGRGNSSDAFAWGPITSGYIAIATIDSTGPKFGVWYKVMGGTPDLTVQGEGGGDAATGVVYGAYVIDGSTIDPGIFDQTATSTGQVTAVPNGPSIVTQTAGAWVITHAAASATDSTRGTVTNYTLIPGATVNESDDFVSEAAYRVISSPTTEDPPAWSSWASGTGGAITIALKPAPPVVDTPAYDNGTGTYNNDVSVAITVASPAGATICYTTDGSTPAAATPGTCSNGTTYSGAVSITATGTVLKAIGTKAGYTNSAVQSATYTLTVGAITSSPGAGTYYKSTQSVTLSIATTTGATAHYTTDGSAVTCSSTAYSGPFNVSGATTVKAIGCKTNYNSDTAISDLYTVGLSTAIEIRAQDYTTSVSSITFPPAAPGATVSQPYNNIDTASNPQIFGGASTAKPVVTLYNGGASTLTIWYNITTFTNSVVSSENYLVNNKGAACADASCITGTATFDADTTTGTTIAVGAGNEKDFYLKITLSAVAAKTGTSTLTILGESL